MVIVASGGLLRIVDLSTGIVREGDSGDVVRALVHPSAAARDLALELVRDKKIEGVDQALSRMLADDTAALSTRLRAATVLAGRGDPAGQDLVVRAAREPLADGVSKDDHAYAVENLPVVLGADALPFLRGLMHRTAGDAWHAAQLGFAALGEESVPTLLEMLAETGESPDYRGGAAHALGLIGAESALPGLLRAVGDPDEKSEELADEQLDSVAGGGLLEPVTSRRELGDVGGLLPKTDLRSGRSRPILKNTRGRRAPDRS